MKPIPDLPRNLDCVCFPDDPWCACGGSEVYLRHVIIGNIEMTNAQRNWCVDQITDVEGYEAPPDDIACADLATMTLHAWADFCRDKGLL